MGRYAVSLVEVLERSVVRREKDLCVPEGAKAIDQRFDLCLRILM
jgi:hypothetical protein